jgi:hypothetical protein
MATPTSLPASFTAGAVLTAAQMNDLRGAFRVLQVVSASTSTPVTSTVTTYADTGLTASITPQSNTSKILVIATSATPAKTAGDSNNVLNLRLMRGATVLTSHLDMLRTNSAVINYSSADTIVWLDSPATTSATTYKVQLANGVAASLVAVQTANSESSIILMEISA